MELFGLKTRVSHRFTGFAGLTPLRSGHHSFPGLKAWAFQEYFIDKVEKTVSGPVFILSRTGDQITSLIHVLLILGNY